MKILEPQSKVLGSPVQMEQRMKEKDREQNGNRIVDSTKFWLRYQNLTEDDTCRGHSKQIETRRDATDNSMTSFPSPAHFSGPVSLCEKLIDLAFLYS